VFIFKSSRRALGSVEILEGFPRPVGAVVNLPLVKRLKDLDHGRMTGGCGDPLVTCDQRSL
jgi:hypothetical protein